MVLLVCYGLCIVLHCVDVFVLMVWGVFGCCLGGICLFGVVFVCLGVCLG